MEFVLKIERNKGGEGGRGRVITRRDCGTIGLCNAKNVVEIR